MIDWLVGFALRKRLVVAMICVFVARLRLLFVDPARGRSLSRRRRHASPRSITTAPGLAAEEVEQQVTIPLERELNGTPGMTMMRSRSTFGLSLITLVVPRRHRRLLVAPAHHGADPERDAAAEPVAGPRSAVVADRADPLLHARSPTRKNLRELSEIEQWTVIPTLEAGAGRRRRLEFRRPRRRSIQLELDPQQLMRFNLSLSDITDAISANNANAGGSVLNRGELGYVIRGIGLVQTLDDLGNIVVTQHNGTPILVRDLGKLKLVQPGAPRHRRPGRQERRRRRHRAAAARTKTRRRCSTASTPRSPSSTSA